MILGREAGQEPLTLSYYSCFKKRIRVLIEWCSFICAYICLPATVSICFEMMEPLEEPLICCSSCLVQVKTNLSQPLLWLITAVSEILDTA
jgi:hypothetical protein